MNRPVRRAARCAAAALTAAVAMAACSGDEPGGRPATTPSATPTSTTASPASTASSPPTATPGPTPTGSPTSAGASGVPAGLQEFYAQRPRWRACDDGFQCATVTVPLNYSKPDGGDIELSVIRLPARNKDLRIGSLLLNPGGPGGSGVDYARDADLVVSGALRRRYDIVGFDPRGVGASTPLSCLTDRQLDRYVSADGSPDTRAEERALSSLSRGLAEGCRERSGRLLPHVGTADAARDMDVLRAIVGDERLNYLGKSYGTFLGATYAELFPERAGRLVLDGAIDPRRTSEEVNLEQATGFEGALSAYVADCLRDDECPLSGSRAAALRQLDRLLAEVDAKPLPTDDGRPVTQSLALLGIVAALYDEESGWPVLSLALEEAFDGDGSTLLSLADYYTDRDLDGTYTTNANEVIYAVNCLDRPEEEGVAAVRQQARRFETVSPRFGAYLAWSALPCSYWPVRPQGSPGAIRAEGAPPILVVGTLRDPATPYEWSVGLAGQLDSGVLLSWDGDGHTAYMRGSNCVDDAVDAFLLRGEAPRDGTRCR